MKKQILALSVCALAAVGFASCGNNQSTEGTYTQEQMDSILKAKEDSAALAEQAYNDSLLAAQAADSIAKADSLAKINATTTTTTKKTTTTTSKKPTTSTSNNNTPAPAPEQPRTEADKVADKKASRFGDEGAKERTAQDAADKKASRFGDEAAKAKQAESTADKKASRF